MDLPPHPGPLPGAEVAPTAHARPASHLRGEQLPGNAALEHEENARQDLAPIQGFAPRMPEPTPLRLGKQGLDELPQCVRDQFLGHVYASLLQPTIHMGHQKPCSFC